MEPMSIWVWGIQASVVFIVFILLAHHAIDYCMAAVLPPDIRSPTKETEQKNVDARTGPPPPQTYAKNELKDHLRQFINSVRHTHQ